MHNSSPPWGFFHRLNPWQYSSTRATSVCSATRVSQEEAFPGRFLLGLGVSHHHLVDRVRHHDYAKPYSRMVEYLDRAFRR